jgi:hypothetical protein
LQGEPSGKSEGGGAFAAPSRCALC